jgi:hypothetical protein
MSIMEKIREMSSPVVSAVSVQNVPAPPQEDAEIKLRRKAGVLAAFGLADKTIADTLFISLEQVAQIRETVEFRESCAKQTMERTQRLMDLEEGWDGIEGMGVAQVMTHLQHSRDPEFALRAALVANKANRRAPSSIGRVIDASNVGNVITLTVNKNYITRVTNNNSEATHAVIEASSRSVTEIPRKASDISSPKRLGEILNVDGAQKKAEELKRLAETVGISLDELDDIVT